MFRYKFIILILFLLPAFACQDPLNMEDNVNRRRVLDQITEKDSSNAEWDGSVIKPLKKGNSWTYEYNVFNSIGEVYLGRDISELIDSDVLIGGDVWYIYLDMHAEFAERNSADGLHYVSFRIFPQELRLKIKYPMAVGDEYDYDTYTVSLVSKNEIVNVPAGEYECYLYRMKADGSNSETVEIHDYYYKPGLGKVLQEYYEYNTQTEKKKYLEVYKLKSFALMKHPSG